MNHRPSGFEPFSSLPERQTGKSTGRNEMKPCDAKPPRFSRAESPAGNL